MMCKQTSGLTGLHASTGGCSEHGGAHTGEDSQASLPPPKGFILARRDRFSLVPMLLGLESSSASAEGPFKEPSLLDKHNVIHPQGKPEGGVCPARACPGTE
eukprot:5637-Amphidinium_carterae.1